MTAAVLERFGAAVTAARAALDALQPDTLTDAELAEFAAACRRQVDVLTGAVAVLLARVEQRQAWRATGATSATAWLAGQVGTAPGRARAELAAGRAITSSPQVAQAVADGQLSTDRAQLLAAVVDEPAFAEHGASLLQAATSGEPVRQLQDRISRWQARHATSPEHDREAARFARRSLTWSTTADGMLRGELLLTMEAGRRVQRALAHLVERQRTDGSGRTRAQRTADALVELAAAYAAGQVDGGRERPQLLVTVPLEVLEQRAGRAELADGGTLSAEAVHRLCCDAKLFRVLTRQPSVPLDLGRGARTASEHQYRALVVRDGGCVVPGCDRPPGWCEAHHFRLGWQHGGRTDLDELCLVCSAHHHLLHEGGFTLTRAADGTWQFTPPGSAPPQPPGRAPHDAPGSQHGHLRSLGSVA